MMHMRERVGYLPVVPMLCCSFQRPEVLFYVFVACYSFSSSFYLLMTPLFVQVPMIEDGGGAALELLDHHVGGLLLL